MLDSSRCPTSNHHLHPASTTHHHSSTIPTHSSPISSTRAPPHDPPSNSGAIIRNFVRLGVCLERAACTKDAEQLRVVLRALLRNCFEACGDKGSIRVEIKAIDASGWLQIRDNGQRLTEEQQRHAFDPFYSGRSAGRGLGFGLSNSWRIVKAHGGEILLDTHQDRGCTTTILWPLA